MVREQKKEENTPRLKKKNYNSAGEMKTNGKEGRAGAKNKRRYIKRRRFDRRKGRKEGKVLQFDYIIFCVEMRQYNFFVKSSISTKLKEEELIIVR